MESSYFEYHNDEENSHKFYRLTIFKQGSAIVRYGLRAEWGRIGTTCKNPKEDFYSSISEVMGAYSKQCNAKMNKGYLRETDPIATHKEIQPKKPRVVKENKIKQKKFVEVF